MDSIMIDTTMTTAVAMEVVVKEISVTMRTIITMTVAVSTVVEAIVGVVTTAVIDTTVIDTTMIDTTMIDNMAMEIISLDTHRELKSRTLSLILTAQGTMHHQRISFRPLMTYCTWSSHLVFFDDSQLNLPHRTVTVKKAVLSQGTTARCGTLVQKAGT